MFRQPLLERFSFSQRRSRLVVSHSTTPRTPRSSIPIFYKVGLCAIVLFFSFVLWSGIIDVRNRASEQNQIVTPTNEINTKVVPIIKPAEFEVVLTEPMKTLFSGLQNGMHLEMKAQPSSKHISLVFITGLKGSGIDVWMDVMKGISNEISNVIIAESYSEGFDQCLIHCLADEFSTAADELNQELTTPNCECLQQSLVAMSQQLSDGSVVIAPAFAFPLSISDLDRFPNLVKLISIAQNNHLLKDTIFDVKIIVNRRSFAHSTAVVCNDARKCNNFLMYLSRYASELEAQLLSIDPSFWILIDFDDFVSRPKAYSSIMIAYLQLQCDTQLIDGVLQKRIVGNSDVIIRSEEESWAVLEQTGLSAMVHTLFYADHVKNRWALLRNPFFTVTPENMQFLSDKI